MAYYSISADIRKTRPPGRYAIIARYTCDDKSYTQVGHNAQSISKELRTLAITFEVSWEIINGLAEEVERKFFRTPYRRGGVTISASTNVSEATNDEDEVREYPPSTW